MRSPKPSSFKNFSTPKKRHTQWFVFGVVFLGVAGLGTAGFFLWETQSGKGEEIKAKETISPIVPPPDTKKPEDAYRDFEESEEVGEVGSQDMEEGNDASSREDDSELVKIFKDQERQNLAPFSADSLWQKNAQKRVAVPKGKHQVGIVMDGMESLSAEDWQVIHKLKVPLTFVLSAQHPEARAFSEKAWKQGREIMVRSKAGKERLLEKQFPHLMGLATEAPSKILPLYLNLSRSKGLRGGLSHRVFSFPLIRDKKAFLKSERSIVWISLSRGRVRQVVEWVQQQKSKVVFVPLSQFAEKKAEPVKPETMIDPKKLKSSRVGLV